MSKYKIPPWQCSECGARWYGALQAHQCDPEIVRRLAGRAAENGYEQSVYRAQEMAIVEDAQREVDAIVTDDGA